MGMEGKNQIIANRTHEGNFIPAILALLRQKNGKSEIAIAVI